ncbi:hypothetical protein [Nocardioides perillae]|uniref:Uncharacterized protein n=1 Tax=Nocardioides perillae TaxID=1119534 RepID=A0A7Y9RUQ5_9ACTN|nr:hypothetical protein [Nocardioides perillae]NYG54968.1 hypothetical protein [Nocardioides perillae]
MTAALGPHEPPPPPRLTGDEPFIGLDATVRDFWAYAVRDLRSNTTRGFLAEWLVLRAVGATEHQPDWHSFDVLTPSGLRVEVKSSAYLQSWPQKVHSTIRFGGLSAEDWSDEAARPGTRTFNSDVYVFCLQTATRHDDYDPLDVDQWTFFVLSRMAVEGQGRRSLGLSTLDRLTDRLTYAELAAAIEAAGAAGASG